MKAVIKYGFFILAILGFIVGEFEFGVGLLILAIVLTILIR